MRVAVVLLGMAALISYTVNTRAQDKSPSKSAVRKLSIASSSSLRGYEIGKSAYTQVVLDLEISKDGGKGSLILDPNIHHLNGYGEVTGGTKVGYAVFEIKLTPTEKPDSAGPPIYRVEGDQLPEKMLLVAPEEAGRNCRLLITDDKYGPVRVILLEPKAR